MIIFASVASGLPSGFYAILQLDKVFWFVAMIVLTILIIIAVVFVELGQRRIPVQFAKRVVGRRMMGGQNTYIPLKVNQSGVIPIIFASSILLLPAILASFLGSGEGWRGTIVDVRRSLHPQQPERRLRHVVRAVDHRLRLLLQLDRLRPGAPGRPDPPPGRVHPRCAPGPTDRALPRQGREPDHAAGSGVHRDHRHPPVHRAVGSRRQSVPVRRHQRADLGRRRSRADAPDRQPVDVAQLRGLPR